MPKTLQPTEPNRFNPYITKSISKSLLTPCRTIGLSRKKKTPSTSTSSISSAPNNDSNVSFGSNLEATSGCSVNVTDNGKSKRKKVSKCLIADTEHVTNRVEAPVNQGKQSTPEKTKKRSKVEEIKIALEKEVKNGEGNEFAKKEKREKSQALSRISLGKQDKSGENKKKSKDRVGGKNRTGNDDTRKQKTEETTSGVSQNCELRTYENKKKKLQRSLSMKRSISSREDFEEFDDLIVKDCSIHLTQVELEPQQLLMETAVPSQREIAELEKQVQAKRQLVEKLRQAKIYRKKHDVEQLHALAAQWKKGCIAGLNDLQPRLQENTDMQTLLNSLGVPTTLVTVSQNGDLT